MTENASQINRRYPQSGQDEVSDPELCCIMEVDRTLTQLQVESWKRRSTAASSAALEP